MDCIQHTLLPCVLDIHNKQLLVAMIVSQGMTVINVVQTLRRHDSWSVSTYMVLSAWSCSHPMHLQINSHITSTFRIRFKYGCFIYYPWNLIIVLNILKMHTCKEYHKWWNTNPQNYSRVTTMLICPFPPLVCIFFADEVMAVKSQFEFLFMQFVLKVQYILTSEIYRNKTFSQLHANKPIRI